MPDAALAQTPSLQPARPEPAPRFRGILANDAETAAFAMVSTPETKGGPFGRVQCGKCNIEFLSSRANLKCPGCGGTPTSESLERAFGAVPAAPAAPASEKK